MEISVLKVLSNILDFLSFSTLENIGSEQKYYQEIEEILKLLKLVLDPIVELELASDELKRESEKLGELIDESRELFETWHPWTSKVYFVLHIESLILYTRTSVLEILLLLKLLDPYPDELNLSCLEQCMQKIKMMGGKQTSNILKEAIRDQVEGAGPRAESLSEIEDSLNLKSNQELLIEVVALEKLKENAEQSEDNAEVNYIDKMIALVTHMHDRLITFKQSQSSGPAPLPSDFCCPLSLELMIDPVIVASGQTYERNFIRNWFDLGLTVCPKTRQTLSRTNLIPNYTVKALIAIWCESNNVKLPTLPRSPESTRPAILHGKNLLLSSGTHSEGSLPDVVGNGHTMSPDSSEDNAPNSEELGVSSIIQPSISESRNDFVPNESDCQSSDNNKLISSGSITLEDSNSNNVSQMSTYRTVYSTEVSGEVSTQQREPKFSPRLESRSRSYTSERLVARLTSSPAIESRPDLLGVETEVRNLIEDLNSSSIDTQRDGTERLRLLAKYNMDNRIVIASCGAITSLVNLLSSIDPQIQENSVTALLNLSINNNNKLAIANAGAIQPLIHVLGNGTSVAKENSAATLFSLSVIEDNRILIGQSGAVVPLVDLLGNGTPRGKKDAATALFNLSTYHENKAQIVEAGAVRHLMDLMDPAAGMVDKAVAVLANLATIPEGKIEIGRQDGGISVLVEVVELGSARAKENAAAALLQLCQHSTRFCNRVLQEGAVPPLAVLSHSGTPRAKEKAQALLNCFRNQRHGNPGRA